MDEPVAFRRYPLPPREEPECIVKAVENALVFDDKDEFLRLVKDPTFDYARSFFGADEVFELDAVNCALAVINGETKGILDIEGMEEGSTPLHFAAINSSIKITEYLLRRGDSVDVHADWPVFNLKQATPIDFLIENLAGLLCTRWIHRNSVYELLVVLCCNKRRNLEVLRMLVRNTQNKERVRQTFMDYANKRELVPVALLFLAAPELFLSSYVVTPVVVPSSIATLYHVFSSLKNRTDIEEAMLLLVDALATAGHKFVAYTRLQYPNDEQAEQADSRSHLDIAFLVREVARSKQGLSSPDDYLLRFFKPVRPEADQLRNIPGQKRVERWRKDERSFLPALLFEFKRYDLDQAYINRVLPSLTTEDADGLNNAIEKKLSLMPPLYGRLEDFMRTPKQGEKIPLQRVPFSPSTSYGPSLRSLSYMVGGECGLDSRNTPTNSSSSKAMKPTNLGFLFSHVRPFLLSNIFKRLIK